MRLESFQWRGVCDINQALLILLANLYKRCERENEQTGERPGLTNPIKLSSLLASHTRCLSLFLSICCCCSRAHSMPSSNMVLRHEANKRLPQNKIRSLLISHVIHNVYNGIHIFRKFTFQLNGNIGCAHAISLFLPLAWRLTSPSVLRRVYLFLSPIFGIWMGFGTVCAYACIEARLCQRASWLALFRSLSVCGCEKPVFHLIKFILKFVAHRFRKQY